MNPACIRTTRRATPWLLVCACLLALPAQAAADANKKEAGTAAGAEAARAAADLAKARADLAEAARRVAELSRTQAGGAVASLRSAQARPRLGVLLGEDPQAGVRIVGVTPGSGAEKAGLRSGDRLLRIRGKAIAGGTGQARVEAARQALAQLQAGGKVQLTYQRDGREHTVEVAPEALPVRVIAHRISGDGALGEDLAPLRDLAPELRREVLHLARGACADGEECSAPLLGEALRWNGLHLVALDAQLGRYFGTDRGVLVLSQGALPGLQAGDVIQQVEGVAVATPAEAMRRMAQKKPGEQARVTVLRERSARQLQVTVPEPLRALDFVPAPPAPPARPAHPDMPPPPAPPRPPTAQLQPPASVPLLV